ncbi:Deoxyguanosinetriphosphate triphosphohydrolase-like protein [Sphingomonas sp. S2M10]|nr:anti-phage deoxyguanosine triphosphatase [Sphingomonas sp. S2M10]NLS25318.1 Deoxyguanosinetriphosphate triphosphohydrolase-like protein [Sphingomonas sp. S2M10]
MNIAGENSDCWSARREGWAAQSEDARDSAAIDYARVIHSASFRRLQGKTQILNLGDSDFYRNRLTHSIEVAQVAGGLARQMQKSHPDHPACAWIPDLTMIQAIGATHDLGHPPFGHGGEVALNYCMRDAGGFEGNGQTLRILARLERFSAAAGSNLTRRTLLGILKYPAAYSAVRSNEPGRVPRLADGPTTVRLIDRAACKPPKCYLDTEADVVAWLLDPLPPEDRDRFVSFDKAPGKHGKTRFKSFDCSIMDLADDIAFGVHDLEDALAMRLMSGSDLVDLVPDSAASCFLDSLKKRYPNEFGNNVYDGFIAGLSDESRRKRYIGRLVGHFITNVIIDSDESFATPLLRYRANLPQPQRFFLETLKDAVAKRVIYSASVQHLEFKGQNMVVQVFEALASAPDALLPESTRDRFAQSDDPQRVICDHVAGMTDSFLLKTYERLFSPRMGSVFDRI